MNVLTLKPKVGGNHMPSRCYCMVDKSWPLTPTTKTQVRIRPEPPTTDYKKPFYLKAKDKKMKQPAALKTMIIISVTVIYSLIRISWTESQNLICQQAAVANVFIPQCGKFLQTVSEAAGLKLSQPTTETCVCLIFWYTHSRLGSCFISMVFVQLCFTWNMHVNECVCAPSHTQTFGFLCLLATLQQRKEVSEPTMEKTEYMFFCLPAE